jgi:signal transduction histidine kinase
LAPNKSAVVISKINNLDFYLLSFKIETIEQFNADEGDKKLYWGIFIGIGTLVVLFNFVSFLIYKEKGFMAISLYVMFNILYYLSIDGILYYINVGINPKIINMLSLSFGMLASMFLVLYPYYFFRIKQKYQKLTLLIFISSGIYFIGAFFIPYAYFFDNSLNYIVTFIFITADMTALVMLFIVGIKMYRNKEIGAIYYIIAHGSIFTIFIAQSLAVIGIGFDFNQIAPLVSIMIIVEMLAFMMMQFYKIKQEQRQLVASKNMLLEQSRFNSIGKSIGNITHQWKHPLSQLGYSLGMLETVYKHDKDNFDKTYEKSISKLNSSVELMSNTIDQFTQFYSGNIVKSEFYPKEVLTNTIIPMLEVKIIKKDVKFDLDIKNGLKINGYKNIFANIMMILIDNSLDAFEKSNDNHIKISIKENKIVFIDNAGGIKVEPIERVFDPLFTTKDEKGNGLGLNMVKMLVEEQLSGSVNLENYEDGIKFEISFN